MKGQSRFIVRQTLGHSVVLPYGMRQPGLADLLPIIILKAEGCQTFLTSYMMPHNHNPNPTPQFSISNTRDVTF